jgi:hypothetical protein
MRIGPSSFGTANIGASLALAFGLVLAACGGSSSERAEPTWRPTERTASLAQHWWWEPVERACEEDDDCRAGEVCRNMRLGTCRGCPRGEEAMVCQERDQDGRSRSASGAR